MVRPPFLFCLWQLPIICRIYRNSVFLQFQMKVRTGGLAGVSDGSDPNGAITREQLATILYRYTGEPEVTGNLEDYPDADSVSDYARSAMLWAVSEGLINGMTQKDGSITLSPTTNANRAQIATILMRYLRAQETVE